jgi:hypothetical protein
MSLVLHDKTFKLIAVRISQRRSSIDTHTFESRAWERILHSQGETKRLNGPKSVVGPFDEVRRVGKASGIES